MVETFRLLSYQIPAKFFNNFDSDVMEFSYMECVKKECIGNSVEGNLTRDKLMVYVSIRKDCFNVVMDKVYSMLDNHTKNIIDMKERTGLPLYDAMIATFKDQAEHNTIDI